MLKDPLDSMPFQAYHANKGLVQQITINLRVIGSNPIRSSIWDGSSVGRAGFMFSLLANLRLGLHETVYFVSHLSTNIGLYLHYFVSFLFLPMLGLCEVQHLVFSYESLRI